MTMPHEHSELDHLIAEAEQRLAVLETQRAELLAQISDLQSQRGSCKNQPRSGCSFPNAKVTKDSTPAEKLTLFRQLFRGRDDVYARRWENQKTGVSGFQPACGNEWVRGLCDKPRVKCVDCLNRALLPITDVIVRNHIQGFDPQEQSYGKQKRDFTIGIYPLLRDETCWFLALDFDRSTWHQDALAFLETCRDHSIPAGLERSRSGNGGHIWIFFDSPVPASSARKLGSFLLTETMESRPEIGLGSYDRLFPNQDTMPHGGFGSLIALPLQKKPREQGNSLFVDDALNPYSDQIAFLSSLGRMSMDQVEGIVSDAERKGSILGVRLVSEEEDDEPWKAASSRSLIDTTIAGPLPEQISLVLANQVYVPNEDLSPALTNRLIRLAAFQNPEFYKAQAMRLPTFGKPRIICCAEDFSKHIGLPRGCLDEILELLQSLGIRIDLVDERVPGVPIDARFEGNLHPEQMVAAGKMLAHDTGVLAASTAFGKTVVAAHIIAERRVNTLVLVHRQQLLDQWVARLSAFLSIEPKEIGRIGGGKHKPTGLVDVALIQSLCRKDVVDDVVAQYGHLIVDECHHLSASSFERVAKECKARYVTGLSATTTRKDGHHPIIFMQCGPVRYRVDARKQAASRPFEHRVVVRETVFSMVGSQVDPTIQDIYSALMSDEARNAMILDDVISAVDSKRSPVVITERKEHLEMLAEHLRRAVRNVIVLKGGTGVKQRRAVAEQLASIPEDEERVLVATGRYLGEGFDDARLDTLFLTMPISWRGTLAQYAGRIQRLHGSKTEVLIYDYADLNVPMLARMYQKRLKGYVTIGYTVQCGSCE